MKEFIIHPVNEETEKEFINHGAPELVRCKNCKRSSPSAQFCYEWYQPTRPNGYCHKAQEKEGGQE